MSEAESAQKTSLASVGQGGAVDVQAEILLLPCVNLALQQNGLSLVQSLRLRNAAAVDLVNLEGVFFSEPGFTQPCTVHVERLDAGTETALGKIDLKLDFDFLAAVTDLIKGRLVFELRSDGQTLLRQEHAVEVLAPDQWLGLHVMPELLAAFVTPNLETVTFLQGQAAAELEKATGSSAMIGYQHHDRKDAYELCRAIYRAVQQWGVNYSNPPVTFGALGQKVRFADTVYTYKLGTCLDLTLLFASVMESARLNPVIMVEKGHAYIGCHLKDYYFPDVPMDDLQAVRKLVELDEFLVLETTAVTSDASFAAAEEAARSNLLGEDEFRCAIDIRRARNSGVYALPLRKSTGGLELAPLAGRKIGMTQDEAERQLRPEIGLAPASSAATLLPAARVLRWQQKLLDLSLRNRLLNVRDTRLVIPITCPDIALLEDHVAADAPLTLNALENLLSTKDVLELVERRSEQIGGQTRQLLASELQQKRLWSPLSATELKRRLLQLYRQYRLDLEEGGVNTIYLTLGMLEWKVTERDSKSYFAPILLLPVQIMRRTLAEGVTIARVDEDAVINVTLLELLRREHRLEIPALEPLPTDSQGVDVPKVMQIMRHAVRDLKGWEVREEARLGCFSFTKFIMWNDLNRQLDSLRQHSLVNHLIEGGGQYDDGIEVFPGAEIGRHLDLRNLFCPRNADSSQLTAVKYSELGKTFVLHGPPGTGKSQTITNIIAHNLALGRRVLFVSEKKAALDVVHRRLSDVGLKPFCLELHSNKSGKKDVLEQFAEALAVADSAVPGAWVETADRLMALRAELNAYVEALHVTYPNGFSPYDCFSLLLGREAPVGQGLVAIDCLRHASTDLTRLRAYVADLAQAFASLEPERRQALAPITLTEWTPTAEREVTAKVTALKNAAEQLLTMLREQAASLGLDSEDDSLDRVAAIVELATALPSVGNIPAEFLLPDVLRHLPFLRAASRDALAQQAATAQLVGFRLEVAEELDYPLLRHRIEENQQRFALVRWWRNRSLRGELSSLKKVGAGKLTMAELTGSLDALEGYATRQAEQRRNAPVVASLLQEHWRDGHPDWSAVDANLAAAATLQAKVAACCCGKTEEQAQAMAKLATLMPDAATVLAAGSAMRQGLAALTKAWSDFQARKQELIQAFGGVGLENAGITAVRTAGEQILAASGDLRRYCIWRQQRTDPAAVQIPGLLTRLEAGKLAPGELSAAFETAYVHEMLTQILEQTPVLASFIGVHQEERIRNFCALDKRLMVLSKEVVFSRLAARLPGRRTGPCPSGTELGLLQRECSKKMRHKPVRQLLAEIPTLAASLKPCFLMSPLSVAQYLPSDGVPFDLVVFDEASQIPVWDAIGAVARGRQLIVVGDPKQMPPTSFFQKSGETEAEQEGISEVVEDLESILDECLGAGVHSAYLNWHYRSRHESLIAFSNHYYYDDRLYTFPAACDREHLGVRLEFVEGGVYDRRATRTNRLEAERLVDCVFARLANPALCNKSMGVVTFSLAQKDLIEDLVEMRRSEHPEFEALFSDSREEPFFVKNLENVQGDERDVILFSVGYAPDSEGKFSMNFGPLNMAGGERRLNVAITRAKEQVLLFSSIKGYQIDLNRTGAVGATHLKFFLDYAEKGLQLSGSSAPSSAKPGHDGLIESIAGFLEGEGHRVKRHVGSSGFKIDLAVLHPQRVDEYLLGIECDGAAYARQLTVRDRDHQRASVLKGLGWRMYRAWTVDWALDGERARQHLREAVDAAIRNLPEPPPPTIKSAPAVVPPPLPPAVEPAPAVAEPVPPAAPSFPVYKPWQYREHVFQETFYDPRGEALISRQINDMIAQEAPVFEQLIIDRITRAWGFKRSGEKIRGIIMKCLPKNAKVTTCRKERIFWRQDQDPDAYREFRTSADDDSRRPLNLIPPQEIANAMEQILREFHACDVDVLYREAVRLFGFSGVSAAMRPSLDLALKVLQETGRI